MTTQQAFNKMVTHLRTQGKKALYQEQCRYRFRGLMCAVGCLIPDSQYRKDFENTPIVTILPQIPALKSVDCGLLIFMQEVHDQYAVSQWEERFERVAETYGLTVPRKIGKRGT